MPKLNAGANVTLTLTDWDSVTVATAGVAVLTAVSGLDVPAGKLAELTGSRTFGPFAPGSLRIDASVVDCSYEVADGVRPVAASGGGVAAITGSYVVGQTLTATFPASITGTIQFTRTLAVAPFTKTAISGAVASGVSSLTYQLQPADAGYNIGVDCTTVQAGVGVTVASDSSAGYVRKVMGVSMPFGDLQSGALTTNSSWRTVRRFPQAFKRIRCYLFNLDAANAMTGAKACWSPSESLANGSRPTIGGAVNNGSSYRFLFNGALTTTLPAGPGDGVPSVTVSDWLDTPSIPATDGNPYPIGYFTMLFTSGAQIGYSAPLNPFAGYLNGLAGTKHAYGAHNNNGDCVENPALFTQNSTSQFCVPMLIEVEYFTGVRTIIACGDSTLQGAGNTAYAGAALMAMAQLDAANMPADACILAETGSQARRQDLRLKNIVAKHIPDIIYFQVFSVNDSSNYFGSSAAAIARVDYWIEWCATNGVNLILDTPLPIVAKAGTPVSGANLTALADMTAYILSKASTKVKVLDLTPLHSAQYSGVWATAYGFDGYHPNPAGHQLRADLLTAAIKSFG